MTVELYKCVAELKLGDWHVFNEFYDSYVSTVKRFSEKTKTFVTQNIKKYAEFNGLDYEEVKSNGIKKFTLKSRL